MGYLDHVQGIDLCEREKYMQREWVALWLHILEVPDSSRDNCNQPSVPRVLRNRLTQNSPKSGNTCVMYVYVCGECVRVWYSRLKKYVNDTVKSFCVVIVEDYVKVILGAGVYKFKKMQKQPENPMFQKGYTTQVPYEGPQNIGRHSKKFRRHGDMSLRICALLRVSSFAISAWGYK